MPIMMFSVLLLHVYNESQPTTTSDRAVTAGELEERTFSQVMTLHRQPRARVEANFEKNDP